MGIGISSSYDCANDIIVATPYRKSSKSQGLRSGARPWTWLSRPRTNNTGSWSISLSVISYPELKNGVGLVLRH